MIEMTLLLVMLATASFDYGGYEGYSNSDGNALRRYLAVLRWEIMEAESKLYPGGTDDDTWKDGDDWLWTGNSVILNINAILEYSRLAAELYETDDFVVSMHELKSLLSSIQSEIDEARMHLYPEYEPDDYGWVWKGRLVRENVDAIFEYSRLAAKLYETDDDMIDQDILGEFPSISDNPPPSPNIAEE